MRPFVAEGGLGVQMYHEDIYLTDPSNLWEWVRQRRYVIEWCNTPWADGRTGEITDT